MKNKKNANLKEESSKLFELDKDQLDKVTGGGSLDDIVLNENPLKDIIRTDPKDIDGEVRESI